MKLSNLTNYLILLLSCFVFSNFQCDGCEERLNDYTYYSVTPGSLQSTFSVGDTLLFSTAFSAQLELVNSGLIHDNANQFIYYIMQVFEGQYDNVNTVPARDKFEFVDESGNVSELGNHLEIAIENTCDQDSCKLAFGMIPQQPGYFGVALRLGRLFGKACQDLSLYPNEIESNGNNHFEVFEEINLSGIRVDNAYFSDPASEKRMYFFKVVE